MDVKCEKCGTEYEFDDAKVSESGITVKCTHCGHLFRVARDQSPVASEPVKRPTPPPRPNHWMIRNQDGEIREFKDLATLQQWIIERKVSRQDEISKTGESWKPLGSIIELSSFFIAVEGEAGARVVDEKPPAQPKASVMTPSKAPAPPPPQTDEDLLDTGEFRLEGPGDGRREAPPPTPAPTRFPVTAGSASTPTPTSRRLDTPTPEPSRPAVTVHRTPPPTFSERFTPPPYDPQPPPSGGARGFVMGVLVSLLLVGGGYFAYQHFNRPQATDADALLKLERAERALETDTDKGREQASLVYAELVDAMGPNPRDRELAARVHVGMARVATARAEYQRLEGSDARETLDRAERSLANARSLASDHPEVLLAYADFYRVMGSPDSARRYLGQARQAGANPAELALIEASMGLHEKDGDHAAVAGRLANLPPETRALPRARFLHAVALERADRREEAIQVLVDLLSRNRQHAAGSRLLQVLGAGKPALAEVTPKADAGTAGADTAAAEAAAQKAAADKAAADKAAAEKEAEQAAADKAAAEKAAAEKAAAEKAAAEKAAAEEKAAERKAAQAKKDDDDDDAPAGASYDVIMRRGHKLLESGRTRAAMKQFRRAIDMRPQSAEAWANLAWGELDMGNASKAVRYFGRALETNSRFADAMYGRAVAYERAGQKANAAKAYERFLAVHPSNRKAETVRRRLERLK